jgi:TPR repeat protein
MFCEDAEYSLTPLACANLFLLFSTAYQRRDERFGNARFVRNVYEAAVNRQAARLATASAALSKGALVTIDAPDIPFELVPKCDAGTVEFTESKWQAECPACRHLISARVRFLGNRVTCKCGQAFIYPWWNPMPDSLRNAPPGLIQPSRPGDRLGIVSGPKAAPPVPLVEPQGPAQHPTDAPAEIDTMVERHWAWFLRTRKDGGDPIALIKALAPDHAAGWEAAAQRGHVGAQCLTGLTYCSGAGAKSDATVGTGWLRQAAQRGDAIAAQFLAFAYKQGIGVPKSAQEAAVWYQRAAEYGDSAAQLILSTLYLNGDGVPQNEGVAFTWLKRAAEQGEAVAQFLLGGAYRSLRDYAQAIYWYQRAAEQNNAEALAALANLHSDVSSTDRATAPIIFLVIDGKQEGPYRMEQVMEFYLSTRLSGDTLYWQQGMHEWRPISELLVEFQKFRRRLEP